MEKQKIHGIIYCILALISFISIFYSKIDFTAITGNLYETFFVLGFTTMFLIIGFFVLAAIIISVLIIGAILSKKEKIGTGYLIKNEKLSVFAATGFFKIFDVFMLIQKVGFKIFIVGGCLMAATAIQGILSVLKINSCSVIGFTGTGITIGSNGTIMCISQTMWIATTLFFIYHALKSFSIINIESINPIFNQNGRVV